MSYKWLCNWLSCKFDCVRRGGTGAGGSLNKVSVSGGQIKMRPLFFL